MGYVVYGSVPWDSPRLNEQNLAHALGRHAPVLYVEPELSILSPLREATRPDPTRGLRHVLRRRPRLDGSVQVFRPLAVPRSHAYAPTLPFARSLAVPAQRRQVAYAARRAGLDRPRAIAMRAIVDLLGAARESALVYFVNDWIEAGGHLLGRERSALAEEQARMCRRADLVCAPSPQIQRSLAARRTPSVQIGHAFHADLAPLYEAEAEPAEYAALPHPRFGYAGRIDARLDFDLLCAVAEQFRSGSLVLIGPVSPLLDQAQLRRLRSHPNVHLIGTRGRDELPPYLTSLDCCLMPYRKSEWADHGSPMKLWDYLYAGPPIVASGYESLRDYGPPLVHYAAGHDDFLRTITAALAARGTGRDERRELALEHTWDRRAAELDSLIAAIESGRAQGGGARLPKTTHRPSARTPYSGSAR